MASYLTTATIGEFDITAYREGSIRYWDAIDPDLFTQPSRRARARSTRSPRQANTSYKRLTRTISVPAGGSQLSFWVNRDTEPDWDFMFVEAHHGGVDDWTTLPDLNGHTSDDTGNSCPSAGRRSTRSSPTTRPTTATAPARRPARTGVWRAASGASDGYEQWTIDLSPTRPATSSSRSATPATTPCSTGVFVDDVAVSSGPGSTSFEDDGDPLDGWTVSGPPAGSPGNDTDWIVGTAADAPPTPASDRRRLVRPASRRSSRSCPGIFGRYPFSAAGGIVDDVRASASRSRSRRGRLCAGFFDNPAERRLGRRPRARAPVDRRQPRARRAGSTSGSTRASRPTSSGCGASTKGSGPRRRSSTTSRRSRPTTRSGRCRSAIPGPDQLFEIPVYWPRRDDAARAPAQDRRRDFFRLLSVGAAASRRQRSTPRVHRARRADLRPGPRRLLHDWLFTPEKPAGIEPAGLRSRAKAQAVYSARSAIKKEMKR